MYRSRIPPPPPRHDLSRRLYDLDARHDNRRRGLGSEDDDDDDDENTELSDNDSILAMAKRMDASSVISDPSFIEGPVPHRDGLDPRGSDEGAGGPQHGGRVRYDDEMERNPYRRRWGDLDSIASGDDDRTEGQDDYDDGSGSQYTEEESMERNPYRPPPGVPRVGHYDDDDDPRLGRYGGSSANANGFRYPGGGRPTGPRGRSHSPDAMHRRDGRSQSHSPNTINRRNSRSQSPSRMSRSKSPRGGEAHVVQRSRYSCDRRDTNDVVDDILSERKRDAADTKRTIKLVALPFIVILVIGVAIGVVFATRGDESDKNPSQNQEVIQISLPTPAPTYVGDYHCPDGFTGPVPTKGCLGYVQCNGLGDIEGKAQPCPSGTLYDVTLNTCSWEESVDCSTKPSAGTGGDADTSIVTGESPTAKPVAAVDTAAEAETDRTGPTTTYNHELSFRGIATLGDVSVFQQNLENYINIFFSPSRDEFIGEDVAALTADDPVLKSLSDVKVDIAIKKFEWSGVTRLRRLQTNLELIMTFDQTTEYTTTDDSLKMGTVVRLPYEERYQPSLIEYLKTTDDVFANLTSVNFLESGQSGGQSLSEFSSQLESTTPTTLPSMSPSAVSVLETTSPTVVVDTAAPFIATAPPTNKAATAAPTTTPSQSSSEEGLSTFPEYATVQGFMWIDTNSDGLYQTTEPPAAKTYASLRHCNDTWVQLTSSNDNGQYQFLGVVDGEYYVEFFRPSDNYQFTIPTMGSDDTTVDSDVALLSGKSACVMVDSSFSQLINVGFVAVDPSDETTTTTTSTASSESDTFKYCAQVTTTSGNQSFEFFGCSTRCSEDSECGDDLRCVLSLTCSKQDGSS